MSYVWAAASFCYFLIPIYVKYLPGNIYENSMASSLSELLANIGAGVLRQYCGQKSSFAICFTIQAIGGVCIIFFGASHVALMPLFVVLAKCGVTGVFTLAYMNTVELFPTLFAATAMGICNFSARLITIFAPLLAEFKPPTPMILFTSISVVGIFLIQIIRIPRSSPSSKNDSTEMRSLK